MKVKTTYTGCDYITAGKEYEVEAKSEIDLKVFWIIDDWGQPLYCELEDYMYFNWEIIE